MGHPTVWIGAKLRHALSSHGESILSQPQHFTQLGFGDGLNSDLAPIEAPSDPADGRGFFYAIQYRNSMPA